MNRYIRINEVLRCKFISTKKKSSAAVWHNHNLPLHQKQKFND